MIAMTINTQMGRNAVTNVSFRQSNCTINIDIRDLLSFHTIQTGHDMIAIRWSTLDGHHTQFNALQISLSEATPDSQTIRYWSYNVKPGPVSDRWRVKSQDTVKAVKLAWHLIVWLDRLSIWIQLNIMISVIEHATTINMPIAVNILGLSYYTEQIHLRKAILC